MTDKLELLSVLLFLVTVGELALLIYKISHRAPKGMLLLSILFFLIPSALFVLHISFAVTVWMILAVVVFSGLHLAMGFPREYRRAASDLTTDAIREATDNLPMGMCYEDPSGRIVLCNDTMHRIGFALTGKNLQTGKELLEGLKNPPAPCKKLSEGYIKLPEGEIYEFNTANIAPGGTAGWRQFTAQNVTMRYAVNEQLQEESENLRKVNRKLRKLYAEMTETIIERETLEMKIYIHDTMGRSLITIKDILERDGQTEKKLETLQEISTMLSARHTALADTMEEVECLAGKMGVAIEIYGYMPRTEGASRLVAAASRECVTNCVKHAHGTRVAVRIRRNAFMYTVIITNNGEAPKGEITEGSGLKNLRGAVESEGGEMYISCNPNFALILNLPNREEEED